MTDLEKPYAGNDLALDALRRYGWERTLAVWLRVSSGAMADPGASAYIERTLLEDLDALLEKEIAHVLHGPTLIVGNHHADFFVSGWEAVLAEARVLVLKIPPEIWPELVPCPRALRLEQRARRTAHELRHRLRRSWQALRGEEGPSWT